MASSRLPGKVLADLLGRPMLARLIERVAMASAVDRIVVATTVNPEDDAIESLARQLGVGCYRGSVEDVMGRVLEAAQVYGADHILALTGDNPLVDPELIDDVVEFYKSGEYDYVTTTHMHHTRNWAVERTFPVGVSVQAFSVSVLTDAASNTTDQAERAHASFAIYNYPDRYHLGAFQAVGRYAGWGHPELRLTVDTPEDLVLMRKIFEALHPTNPRFSTGEAIWLVAGNPLLWSLNRHVPQRLVHEMDKKTDAKAAGGLSCT